MMMMMMMMVMMMVMAMILINNSHNNSKKIEQSSFGNLKWILSFSHGEPFVHEVCNFCICLVVFSLF